MDKTGLFKNTFVKPDGKSKHAVFLASAVLELAVVEEDLDEFVETCGDDGAEHGADPVDPVVVHESEIHNCRSERAGWVEAAAGEVDACEFGDEEGEADSWEEVSVVATAIAAC